MKRSIPAFAVMIVISVMAVVQAFADTSEVHITNDVNTTSNTSSSSNCHTTIHRIVNGQEQDIDSDTCGDIHMGDANNRVDISNENGSNSITITPPPSPTIPPFPTISITPLDISPTIAAEQKKIQEKLDKVKADLEEKKKQLQQQENILQKITDMIKDFFSNLHF